MGSAIPTPGGVLALGASGFCPRSNRAMGRATILGNDVSLCGVIQLLEQPAILLQALGDITFATAIRFVDIDLQYLSAVSSQI